MTDLFSFSDTRSAAAAHIADRRLTLQRKCIQALRVRPMTADEIAAAIDETPLAIRPRITELLQAGEVADTGERRANASGRSAKIWRLVR